MSASHCLLDPELLTPFVVQMEGNEAQGQTEPESCILHIRVNAWPWGVPVPLLITRISFWKEMAYYGQ